MQPWYDGFMDLIIPAVAIAVWMVVILLQPHISCLVIIALLAVFLFISAKIPARSWLTGIVHLFFDINR